MIQDMELRSLKENAQKAYVDAVKDLARHYNRSPDLLSEEELRRYFVNLTKVRRCSKSTLRVRLFGINHPNQLPMAGVVAPSVLSSMLLEQRRQIDALVDESLPRRQQVVDEVAVGHAVLAAAGQWRERHGLVACGRQQRPLAAQAGLGRQADACVDAVGSPAAGSYDGEVGQRDSVQDG
jgi:hypothetical protein